MLHSTYFHKETYEDPKTSAIFENLLLLPDNVFWHILRQSCYSHEDLPTNPGKLLSFDFWPHWDSKGTNNSKYVEPDLFIRFENLDVIIEAKVGSSEGQYKQQWQREIMAYLNMYNDKNDYVFIAVGGNMSALAETILIKKKDVKIHKCNWLSLLINVNRYENELESISFPDMNISATRRLLDNIILAFNIHQVYNIEWFNTMAREQRIIHKNNIVKIQTLFN